MEKACVNCSKKFDTTAKNKKYCGTPCKYMGQPTSEAERWLNKKPVSTKRRNNEAIAYSFFKKKYGVSNKLKVCSG